jgi:hypothetical protein
MVGRGLKPRSVRPGNCSVVPRGERAPCGRWLRAAVPSVLANLATRVLGLGYDLPDEGIARVFADIAGEEHRKRLGPSGHYRVQS